MDDPNPPPDEPDPAPDEAPIGRDETGGRDLEAFDEILRMSPDGERPVTFVGDGGAPTTADPPGEGGKGTTPTQSQSVGSMPGVVSRAGVVTERIRGLRVASSG